jgi:hypothetical protein
MFALIESIRSRRVIARRLAALFAAAEEARIARRLRLYVAR